MGGGLIFLIVLLGVVILCGIIAAVVFKKKQEPETKTSPNFILAGIAVLWVSLLILTIIIGVVGTDDMNAKNAGDMTKCASNSTMGTGEQVGMGGGFITVIIMLTLALIGLIVAAVLFKKKSNEAAADGESKGEGGASGGEKTKSVTNPLANPVGSGSTADKKNSGGGVEMTVVDEKEERRKSWKGLQVTSDAMAAAASKTASKASGGAAAASKAVASKAVASKAVASKAVAASAAASAATSVNNHHARNSTQLPPDWDKHKDDQGRKYYGNATTQESQWTAPEGSTGGSTGGAETASVNPMNDGKQKKQDHARNETQLPPDWDKHKDDQGRKYYGNATTQESQWTAPEGSTGGSSHGQY